MSVTRLLLSSRGRILENEWNATYRPLPLTAGERALILALGLLLLAVEAINTAIEYTVDYISTDQHPLAGRAKDAGSAAVFLTSIAGGVAWIVVLLRLVTGS